MVAAFSPNQSDKARSLGYEQEKSPTLRGGEGGNQKPVVMACDLYNQSVDGQTAASVTAAVGGVNTSGPKLLAFAQNQRDEVRDLNDLSGALAAEPGMKQQTYVMAVDCRNGAENSNINGTLQAKDGGGTSLNLNNVVRTSGAMNPWDAQSARVYGSEGVWHSLNANENGGQSRDSVLKKQLP